MCKWQCFVAFGLSAFSLTFPPEAWAQATAAGESIKLTHIPGSTAKLEQLIGDQDNHKKAPTANQTFKRYRIQGTDLGYSFEHDGKAIFLFGDTIGRFGGDVMASSATTNPERGLSLDFFTDRAGNYLKVGPPGVSMKGFEVPVSGISLAGKMYVVIKTDHSEDRPTDVSLLTIFDPNAKTFQVLREVSRLPEGKVIKMSMRRAPEPIAGLPASGPHVLVWSSAIYRQSHAYFSIVPEAQFESGRGTRYFSGLDRGAPIWSEKEQDAKPVVEHATIGELSVTWAAPLRLWLMTYNSREPRGILFRYSMTPWGPWSAPQTIFDMVRDKGHEFIHQPRTNDGLAGPVIGKGADNPDSVPGGAYAPYVIERFTILENNRLTIYYVMSTWNPYVVVLMKSAFAVERSR